MLPIGHDARSERCAMRPAALVLCLAHDAAHIESLDMQMGIITICMSAHSGLHHYLVEAFAMSHIIQAVSARSLAARSVALVSQPGRQHIDSRELLQGGRELIIWHGDQNIAFATPRTTS